MKPRPEKHNQRMAKPVSLASPRALGSECTHLRVVYLTPPSF